MVRLERSTARALLGFFDLMGGETRHVLDDLLSGQESLPLDKIIQSINDQVYGENQPTGMLVDVISDIVQNELGRNVLGGSTLADLRTAILIPSERAVLQEKIRKGFACAGCGVQFANSEMATVRKNRNDTSIMCVKCAAPYTMSRCTHAGCESKSELPASLGKLFSKKVECEEHKLKEVQAASTEANAGVEIRLDGRINWDEQWIIANQAVQGGNPGMPVNPMPPAARPPARPAPGLRGMIDILGLDDEIMEDNF